MGLHGITCWWSLFIRIFDLERCLQGLFCTYFWLAELQLKRIYCIFAYEGCLWRQFIRILVFGVSRRLFWSISSSWPKTIARTAHFHCARAIFRSGPNIWFLKAPEGRFEAFLAPGLKPLPERLIFIAREPFFGLDRISGLWSLQKAVLKHFWALPQNHCQNGSFSLRASNFSVWTEYLVFGTSRRLF